MWEILQREAIYLWYYFTVQLDQIVWYWVAGMVFGSAISVFLKNPIHEVVRSLDGTVSEYSGIVIASLLGVASPLCMYGTIPFLQAWLLDGMSMGSASAFMVTGPATKITNLSTVKIILGWKRFALYLLYVMAFACLSGWLVDFMI